MSLTKLVFPGICWGELHEIISYLSLHELWTLGNANRSAFIMFMREKALRSCILKLPRFLSKGCGQSKVLLTSYPRSGNSYMRSLLERKTGLVTGSDSRPNRPLSESLLRHGFAGEGITDDSVWIVKSHYPERLGYIKFTVSQIVLLVRNPFDAILSYFHMGMTNTHDKCLTSDVRLPYWVKLDNKQAFNSLKLLWEEFSINEAKVWADFHRFWLEAARRVPVLLVRFEDFLQHENLSYDALWRYLSSSRCPVGLSRFIPQVEVAGAGYSPKKNMRCGKAMKLMSAAQMDAIEQHCGELMELFGYEVVRENGESEERGGDTRCLRLADCRAEMLSQRFRCSTIHCAANSAYGALIVNDGQSIRSEGDRFGRHITKIRHSLTANDSKPFSTES